MTQLEMFEDVIFKVIWKKKNPESCLPAGKVALLFFFQACKSGIGTAENLSI